MLDDNRKRKIADDFFTYLELEVQLMKLENKQKNIEDIAMENDIIKYKTEMSHLEKKTRDLEANMVVISEQFVKKKKNISESYNLDPESPPLETKFVSILKSLKQPSPPAPLTPLNLPDHIVPVLESIEENHLFLALSMEKHSSLLSYLSNPLSHQLIGDATIEDLREAIRKVNCLLEERKEAKQHIQISIPATKPKNDATKEKIQRAAELFAREGDVVEKWVGALNRISVAKERYESEVSLINSLIALIEQEYSNESLVLTSSEQALLSLEHGIDFKASPLLAYRSRLSNYLATLRMESQDLTLSFYTSASIALGDFESRYTSILEGEDDSFLQEVDQQIKEMHNNINNLKQVI